MSQKTVYELEGVVSIEEKNFRSKAKGVLKSIRDITKGFEVMARKDAGLIKMTERGEQLKKAMEEADKKVEILTEALQRLEEIGAPEEDIEAMARELENAKQEADALANSVNNMRMYGKRGLFEETGPASFIADMKAYAERAKSAVSGVMGDIGGSMRTALSENPFGRALIGINNFRKTVADAGYLVKHYAKGMWNNLKAAGAKIVGTCRKIANGFKKIVHGSNTASASMRGLGRRLFALAAAFVSTYIGLNAIKAGMNNLIAYDARTASSVNTLKGALDTLKNAMATAFAPVLNAIVPILSTLIDWLVAACTAIAHFIAALTGQSQVTIARKSIGGVGSAASGAAGSLGDAADAAEEYKRTLMGFDQINKLDDPTSGSGGSGGGGGGGGAGGGGSMFETVPVDSTIADWADKIKEAWENADFYDIGRAVGEKLRDSLQQIPWDDIQAVGEKIGKSIATGLNGFFETPELGTTIGDTIAKALNTVVITVNSFTINFHWDSLGTFVGDSINGFFKTFDWKLTGETMSSLATGILDATISAVRGVNWYDVGSAIMTMITSIKYVDIATRLVTLLGDAISGAGSLLSGAIDTLKDKLSQYISSGNIWGDLKDLGKVTLEFAAKITGAAWDLLNSLLDFGATIAVELVKGAINKVIDWVYETVTGNSAAEIDVKLKGIDTDGIIKVLKWIGEWILAPPTIKIQMGVGLLTGGAGWLIDKFSNGNSVDLTANINMKGSLDNLGVIDVVANFSSWIKSDKFSNYVTGMTAQYDKGEKKSGYSNTVTGLTAQYDKGKKKKGYSNTVTGLTAQYKGWSKKKGFSNTVTGLTAQFKKWSKARSFSNTITGMRAVISGITKAFATGGVYKNGRWAPVQTAATGGNFSQGQMFIARESGPELVGRIGSGTAVMNNDQIVASVAAGVAQAVASVMNGRGNSVSVYLEGDAGQFFKVMQSKANDYTRSTGQPAFPV